MVRTKADSCGSSRKAVDLHRKWKSLRDSFRRELAKSKKMKSGSAVDTGRKEYMYFQQLSFLLPICDTRLSQGAFDFGAEDSNPELAAPSRLVQQTRKRKSTVSSDDLLIQKLAKKIEMKTKEPEDADKHFLLSLLPHFKVIPDDMKLEVQGEFLSVLSRYKQQATLARQQYLPAPTQDFPGPSSASFPQSQSLPYNTRLLVSPPFQQIATEHFTTNPISASLATSSTDTSSIFVAAQAPRKNFGGAGSSSSGGDGSSPSGKGKYAGGNPVCPRPTPEWQKGISTFFTKPQSSSSPSKTAASSSNSSSQSGSSASDD